MTITVRRADPEDAESLSALNAHVQAIHAAALPSWFKPPGPDTFPPRAAIALFGNPDNLVFLSEVDGRPAGYVYGEIRRRAETPFSYAHEMLYLHHISVGPDFRDRGVGRALLEAARSAAGEQGISLMAADVWSFNEDARAFFRRCGLTTFNERLWNR